MFVIGVLSVPLSKKLRFLFRLWLSKQLKSFHGQEISLGIFS
jgi:hypothetical protein